MKCFAGLAERIKKAIKITRLLLLCPVFCSVQAMNFAERVQQYSGFISANLFAWVDFVEKRERDGRTKMQYGTHAVICNTKLSSCFDSLVCRRRRSSSSSNSRTWKITSIFCSQELMTEHDDKIQAGYVIKQALELEAGVVRWIFWIVREHNGQRDKKYDVVSSVVTKKCKMPP